MLRNTLLFSVLFIPFAAQSAQDDDIGKEAKKFQGKWHFEVYKINGTSYLLFPMTQEFKGDQWIRVVTKGRELKGTFKINPSKEPKEVDSTYMNQTSRGIYRFEGNTLTMCFPIGNKAERPTEFKESLELLKLKRFEK